MLENSRVQTSNSAIRENSQLALMKNIVDLILNTYKCLFFSNNCSESSMLFDNFDRVIRVSKTAWKWKGS